MKGKGTTLRRIALGLLVAAVAVPAAQAADRPDNRAGPFGVAPAVSTEVSSVRPDDRAGLRGVAPAFTAQTSAAVRPDDRAGIRGVGASEPATQALRPDDRPGIRGVGADIASQPSTALRPDDRPGPLGIGEPTFVPVSGGTGFHWGDWAIGLVAGLGVALGLAGVLVLISRRGLGRIGAAATR